MFLSECIIVCVLVSLCLVGVVTIRKLFSHFGYYNGLITSFDANTGWFTVCLFPCLCVCPMAVLLSLSLVLFIPFFFALAVHIAISG